LLGEADARFILGPLVPTLVVAMLGLVGVLSAATISSYSQWRASKLQSRELSDAQIMGRKFVVTKLYVSRFEARIFSDYRERRWTLQGSPRDSLDFDEARRWMQKSEDFAIEIAKAHRELFESIGVAKASFKRNPELDALTKRVFEFRTPAIRLNRARCESSSRTIPSLRKGPEVRSLQFLVCPYKESHEWRQQKSVGRTSQTQEP